MIHNSKANRREKRTFLTRPNKTSVKKTEGAWPAKGPVKPLGASGTKHTAERGPGKEGARFGSSAPGFSVAEIRTYWGGWGGSAPHPPELISANVMFIKFAG